MEGGQALKPKRSAGLLLYRRTPAGVEVLLAHPGGPLWAHRDDGAWSVPKGEIDAGEDELAVARREFEEEIGQGPPDGPYLPLGEIRQKSGKEVVAWACEGDLDPATAQSNTFPLEWPPRSGRFQEVPEVDRVDWFDLEGARRRLNPAQVPLVERLHDLLADKAS